MVANQQRETLVEDSAREQAVGGVWTLRNRESVPDGGSSISSWCEGRAQLNLTGAECRKERGEEQSEEASGDCI